MGTTTTNLDLYKPDQGETGWDDEVNANFDTLDEYIGGDQYTSTYFVDPNGDNANDGLSWATAKVDILGAIDANIVLYGASWSATIYFKDLSYVDATNTDRGLWLGGANDSQFASLPTGWRKGGRVQLVGIPVWDWGTKKFGQARLRGGSYSDAAKPLFWFSGCNTGIRLRNIYGIAPAGAADTTLARPMILGLDSSGIGDTNNSGFVFDNIVLATRADTDAYGPTVYDYSSYWVTVRDCTFSGNATADAESDERAAWVIYGQTQGEGLKTWNNCQFNGGAGIIHYPNTLGPIKVSTITQESLGGEAAPIYWLNGIPTASIGGVLIDNITQADQATSQPIVYVTEGNDPGNVSVRGLSGESPRGPMTILGTAPSLNGTVVRPSSQRGVGFLKGGLYGPHDGARRLGAPAAARFVNRAQQDVSLWSGLSGTASVTTGKKDPYGGTNAAELSGTGELSRRVVSASLTPALGDWVVAGVWTREVSGWMNTEPNVGFASGSYQMARDGAENTNSVPLRKGAFNAVNQGWVWIWTASKVTVIGGGSTDLVMDIRSSTGEPIEYAYPVCYYILASDSYDDGEILDWAQNLSPTSNDSGVAVGEVTTLKAQTFNALGGLKVGGGGAITKVLTGSTTYDPANMATDASATGTTLTVTGAAVGDPCFAGLTTLTTQAVLITAHVTATNTVRVDLLNKSGGALDLGSGTLKVTVFQNA